MRMRGRSISRRTSKSVMVSSDLRQVPLKNPVIDMLFLGICMRLSAKGGAARQDDRTAASRKGTAVRGRVPKYLSTGRTGGISAFKGHPPLQVGEPATTHTGATPTNEKREKKSRWQPQPAAAHPALCNRRFLPTGQGHATSMRLAVADWSATRERVCTSLDTALSACLPASAQSSLAMLATKPSGIRTAGPVGLTCHDCTLTLPPLWVVFRGR